MTVAELKKILENFEDSTEIVIRNSFNICGNISELAQIEESTYGFFGSSLPCLILNSEANIIADNDGEYFDVIKTSGNIQDNNTMLDKYNIGDKE